MNAIAENIAVVPKVDGIIRTYTGRPFNILCPNPDMVDIEDIAHSLAHQPLYNGRTERMYTIAQHSVEVAKRVKLQYRMAALLHHAAAAYMGDITLIRNFFPELKFAEERLQAAIHVRFGVPPVLPPEMVQAIHRADLEMQAAEYRDLLPAETFNWLEAAGISASPAPLVPVPPSRAKHAFKTYVHFIEAADLLGD